MSSSRDLVWQPPRRPVAALPARPAAAGPAGGGISLMRAARGPLRWWWQALLAWAVTSAAACAAILALIRPTYDAASLLRVEPSSTELFGATRASESSYQNFMETQVQLITSPGVLAAAVTGPGAAGIPSLRKAPDPEAALREMLLVRILPKSYLINVSSSSPSPTEAAAAVNAVVKSYLDSDTEWSEGMTKTQIAKMEAYRTGLQSQLDEKQRALLELAARGNAPALEPAGGAASGAEAARVGASIDEYRRLRAQLLDAQLQLSEAEAVRDFRRSRGAAAPAGPTAAAAGGEATPAQIEAAVAEAFLRDPEAIRLRGEVDELNLKLTRADRLARRGNDPSVAGLSRRVSEAQASLDAYWRQRAPALRAQAQKGTLAGAAGPAQADPIKDASERVATLKATVATLERTLARMDVADREHNTDAVKSALLQSDLRRLEEMRSLVDRRLEQLRFESRGQARVKMITPAKAAVRPATDKRPRLLLAAPAGAFALIFAATMLLEIRANRVCAAAELSQKVGVEVFAVPPLPVPRPGRGLARARPRQDLVAEYVHGVDHVREALCGDLAHGAPGRCVLITSAVGGEGKTTLASQLAVRCANAGASTLLIDCDLRRPSLGVLLEVPEGPGFADVLRGDVAPEDALVHLAHLGCYFLPAGRPEANPARVMLGHRLGPLLERLRRSYDVVIIDSPPVLPVPDALTLGRFVDGAVLAARYDSSRMHLVARAHQTLQGVGIPVLGVVVNGIQPSSHFGGDYASAYAAAVARPAADGPGTAS